MGILTWLWSQAARAFYFILPAKFRPDRAMFDVRTAVHKSTEQYTPSTFARSLRWILHAAVVVLIVLGLWWLNTVYDLDKVLRSPWPLLHKVWLPLLFLLGYGLGWIAWFLWKYLGPEREAESYPDID